jgi:hypothetical protein
VGCEQLTVRVLLLLAAWLLFAAPALSQPVLPAYLLREDPTTIRAECEREGTIGVFAREARSGEGGVRGDAPATPELYGCVVPGDLGEAEWFNFTGPADDLVCVDCVDTSEVVDSTLLAADLDSLDAAADEDCLTSEMALGDNFEWQPCITVRRRTADTSNSSNVTWSDVSNLTHAVTDRAYHFTCELTYTADASTTAIHLSVNGPTTSALNYSVSLYTGATAVFGAAQTAYDTVTNPVSSGGATELPARVAGTAVFTASGTFALRFKSEVNTSNVTVKQGSYCLFGPVYTGL